MFALGREGAPELLWGSTTVSFNKHLKRYDECAFCNEELRSAYPPFKISSLEDLPLPGLPVFPALRGIKLFPVCDRNGEVSDDEHRMPLPISTGVVPH